MEIEITSEAAKWYKRELFVEDEAFVRFFVRYGGFGGRIPGFSVGISVEDQPSTIYKSTEKENVVFYIAESDAWYFEGNKLKIEIEEDGKEPKLIFE